DAVEVELMFAGKLRHLLVRGESLLTDHALVSSSIRSCYSCHGEIVDDVLGSWWWTRGRSVLEEVVEEGLKGGAIRWLLILGEHCPFPRHVHNKMKGLRLRRRCRGISSVGGRDHVEVHSHGHRNK